MKFTLAAGILARTLPVISESVSSFSQRLSQDEYQETDLSRFLAQLPAKTSSSRRALTVNARRARRQAHSQSGNQLTNTPFSGSTTVVQCDPLSDDADVGILSSCGPGSECVINKQEGASLGGVCVQTSRALQDESTGQFCYLCGWGFTFGTEHYDAVLDIPEVGYEGATGRDLVVAAYFNYTMDENTCSVVAEKVTAAGFCEVMCDLCGWASYVTEGNYDLPVEVSVAGYDGATCGDLSVASYFNGTIATSSCPVVAEAAKSAGCCYNRCTLCGFGAYIPDDPYPSATCEDLSFGAFINKTIGEDGCAAASQLAETEDCCVPAPTYDCNVCGDATFYPDNAIFGLGTCEETLALFNATECAVSTPDLARLCCAAPSGISSVVPSSAPQESTPSEPGAPSAAPDETPSSPTSKSAAMWSTSTLVSLIGLAAATTAGSLILN